MDSVTEFVKFWHAAYGSPAVSTFLAAINKSFIPVPGLTSVKVRCHPPDSLATAYEHLHATRKRLRSTKKALTPGVQANIPISNDNLESISQPREKSIWFEIHDVRVGRAYSDATGAMPQRWRLGALYQIVFSTKTPTSYTSKCPRVAADQVCLLYCNERSSSSLIVVPTSTCPHGERMRGGHQDLVGHHTHRTGTHACCPAPHEQGRERAIRTWKDHFIATLASTDPECPLLLWKYFVEQAELTLNCMRVLPVHRSLSA